MAASEGGPAVWTEEDDKEAAEIWPHWSEGVPKKLRVQIQCPSF